MKHKHLIVRAEVADPPTKDETLNGDLTQDFVDLVKLINMKIMAGPLAYYCEVEGNRGATAFCIIETSHIALHSWDEDDPALIQLDVYSCADFEPEQVFKWFELFKPIKVEYKFLNRERGLVNIRRRGKRKKT